MITAGRFHLSPRALTAFSVTLTLVERLLLSSFLPTRQPEYTMSATTHFDRPSGPAAVRDMLMPSTSKVALRYYEIPRERLEDLTRLGLIGAGVPDVALGARAVRGRVTLSGCILLSAQARASLPVALGGLGAGGSGASVSSRDLWPAGSPDGAGYATPPGSPLRRAHLRPQFRRGRWTAPSSPRLLPPRRRPRPRPRRPPTRLSGRARW